MTENHVAKLSKNISAQKTGISLLFSKYTSNVIRDYNFQTYDIKKILSQNFQVTASRFRYMMGKLLLLNIFISVMIILLGQALTAHRQTTHMCFEKWLDINGIKLWPGKKNQSQPMISRL